MEALIARKLDDPGGSGIARNDEVPMTTCQLQATKNDMGNCHSTSACAFPATLLQSHEPRRSSMSLRPRLLPQQVRRTMCTSRCSFRLANWMRRLFSDILSRVLGGEPNTRRHYVYTKKYAGSRPCSLLAKYFKNFFFFPLLFFLISKKKRKKKRRKKRSNEIKKCFICLWIRTSDRAMDSIVVTVKENLIFGA